MIFSENVHKHHFFNEKRIFAVFRDLPRNYLYNICIFGHILLKNSVCNALEKTGTHFDLRLTIKRLGAEGNTHFESIHDRFPQNMK